jgi:phosphatidylglycerol:prolipoprotein diacylglycerol transferase
MLPLLLTYPQIDPEIFAIGPFAVRWYALAYVVALVVGWRVTRRIAARPPTILTPEQVDDLLFYIALGVILGGRLGYVLFYKPAFFLSNPLHIVTLWEGGMSFHGGMLGVIGAILFYAWKAKRDAFAIADLLAPVVPQGLFFGRIANFINGELWGRPTDVSWAMIFPRDPAQLPRHPSQLYQACLEGILLSLVLLAILRWTDGRRRPGLVCGSFCVGYGAARIIGELFREPDAHLGFLWGPLTMGMLLSVPMLLFGAFLIARAYRRPALADSAAPA